MYSISLFLERKTIPYLESRCCPRPNSASSSRSPPPAPRVQRGTCPSRRPPARSSRWCRSALSIHWFTHPIHSSRFRAAGGANRYGMELVHGFCTEDVDKSNRHRRGQCMTGAVPQGIEPTRRLLRAAAPRRRLIGVQQRGRKRDAGRGIHRIVLAALLSRHRTAREKPAHLRSVSLRSKPKRDDLL